VSRRTRVPELSRRESSGVGGGMEGLKICHRRLAVSSAARTELRDLTEPVREAIREIGIGAGIALVNTQHTTCALFVNEYQGALLADLVGLIERLVPERAGYGHDDPRISDCERGNAHAHLRAALLGRSLALSVEEGDVVLGRYQSIILAELDGPRVREIAIQVIGG
jgi:secondary thiamine-phosphate synthase enzyme